MSQQKTLPNLLWCDFETTGLVPGRDLPLEIGLAVTDANLNILWEKSYVLQQELYLSGLSDWVFETHTKNGLLREVKNSTWTVEAVDRQLSRVFVSSELFPVYCIGDDRPPLCGSTVGFDRQWLQFYFPETYGHVHYRSIDVSSIKELMKRWMPSEAISNKDTSQHRSLPDIHDSIAELASYRSALSWFAEDPYP